MRLLACFLLSVAAALAWPASAQDIPGRVGRLSYIEGSVGLYQDPDRGWDVAYVNSPITSRNSVWTDPGARAEVVVGPMALRMDEASQLDVSLLDDATLDATLESGSVEAHVRHFRPGDVVRLSTPRASFLLQAAGRYRVDADPDRGESWLTVFSGTAAMETAGGRVRIRAGQSVVVWGDDFPQYAFEDASTTELDRWAMARDERWAESRAPQFVSYEMTGYEDLDAYGEWTQDPVYGALWFPTRVDSDWAPYRFGRWTYVQPWGWTWIDSEPWGYAPFHYGRWVHVRDRWAWCPGRRVERPAWAPALVGFIGGGGWSASISSGAPVVGWYPLAPSEPYRPWYSASRGYVNRVNAAVRNVPQDLARSHVEWNRDRAATVVRREALVERRPVQQARVQVAPEVVRRAPAITAPTTALPSREEFHRAQRNSLARAPTPPAPARASAPATRNGTAPSAPQANALARPSFTKPSAAPRPAPSNAAPPPAPIARRPSSAPGEPARANEAARERDRAAREAQQQQERTAREAQQRDRAAGEARQRDEAAAREAQQRARSAEQEQQRAQQRSAQEQQRAAREAEQERQRASREAAQQQQRDRAAGEARQRDEAAAREAQQRARSAEQEQQRAQQRSAQEQQRAAREAEQERQRASREAAQQQQRAAQEAQQQRERASREAEQQRQRAAQEQQRAAQQRAAQDEQRARQRAAQEAQQQRERASREAEQQRQRAAQEQQRAAQQRAAQERERAAQDQQRAAQQRAAQEQQRAAQEQQRAQQRAAEEQQRAAQAQQRAAQEQQQGKGQAAHGPPPGRGEERGKGRDEREKGNGG